MKKLLRALGYFLSGLPIIIAIIGLISVLVMNGKDGLIVLSTIIVAGLILLGFWILDITDD